ncbi:MAG: DUF1080 domain-containing protein [Fuerstiella sp.]
MINRLSIFSKLVITGCLTASVVGCPADSDSNQDSASQPPVEQTSVDKVDSPVETTPVSAADIEINEFEFIKPELTEAELKAGWISLFDGSTLFGWEIPEGTNWHVEDHCIVADSGDISLLTTPFAFGNFEFRCDFHLAKGGNSGVFLRSADDVKNPATDTYELNICDSHATHKTGSFVGRHIAENVPAVEDEWHTFHVICNQANINVTLDGKQIVDFTDETQHARSHGTIGLQMNKGRVAFRNVYLKPIETQELFNEKDLTGFRDVPGSKGTFAVKDGLIHAEGGPGFLETEATFQDFILHVEANIHDEKTIADGRPANSGVFFRALTGTEVAPSFGYELQIQNDFKNGDRTKALDFGSGGIYRREPARYIVANNNEWFTETLIAQGNRFATFVNGYQVLYWVDDRKPDENPRKGQRLDAGHFSLQGHDPTTNLDFRSLRVHDLKTR